MASFVTPATRLMSRISYKIKFTLVSILFLIPLILTVALYWQELKRDIDLTRSELAGLDLIVLTEPLVVNVGQHRGLTNAFLNGNTGVESKILDRRGKVDNALQALATGVTSAPPSIKTLVSDLQQHWREVKQAIGNKPALEIFEMHNAFAAEVRGFNHSVLTEYLLILDTHAETTFLINNVAEILPEIIDAAGQFRGKASGIAAKGEFTPETYAYLSSLQKNLASLTPVLSDGLKIQELKSMAPAISDAQQGVKGYLDYIQTNLFAAQKISADSSTVFAEGTAAIKKVLALYKAMIPDLVERQQNYLDSKVLSRNLILSVIFITIALAVYLFAGFYSSTISALKSFQTVADKLAQGDLSARMRSRNKDEMAAISSGLNELAEGFEKLVRETQASTDLVAHSTNNLVVQALQTRDGVAKQKDETTHLAAGVSQVAVSANEIAENTQLAAKTTQVVNDMAAEGLGVVLRTTKAFNSFSVDVGQTSEVISELDKDVQNIHAVSSVISEIADQTNLLALNAAIEAARAGEQGRGFAVVADEVRTLAQRTQDSTGEIRDTLSKLQDCAGRAVTLMQRTNDAVSSNVEDMNKASEFLHQIDISLTEMNDMNSSIASAAEEQSCLISNLHQNLTTITDVADSVETTANDTSALADNMSTSAEQLEGTLARFTLS